MGTTGAWRYNSVTCWQHSYRIQSLFFSSENFYLETALQSVLCSLFWIKISGSINFMVCRDGMSCNLIYKYDCDEFKLFWRWKQHVVRCAGAQLAPHLRRPNLGTSRRISNLILKMILLKSKFCVSHCILCNQIRTCVCVGLNPVSGMK
jgi:hypothetical protein